MTSLDRLGASTLRWIRSAHGSVGGVFAILTAAAVLQLATQTFLARALTKPDVGLISLIIGALPLVSALSLLGQDSSTVRLLTRHEPCTFDVPAHLRRVLGLVLPMGLVVAVVGSLIYDLPLLAALCLLVLTISQNAITIITTAIRAIHKYVLAALGTRLPAVATSLLMGVAYLSGRLTLPVAIVLFIVGYSVTAAWVILMGKTSWGGGTDSVPSGVFTEGLFFFGIGVSLPVMVALDKLIIGRMMTYSDLAVYATVFSVMRGFDFLFYSVCYVLLPYVNTLKEVRLRSINAWIAGVASVVTLLYLLLGRHVVHVLFDGKYDSGIFLIVPFALAGIIKLFYSVPSSVIGARLPRASLSPLLWFSLLSIAVNAVLDIVMIRVWGLMGAAIATAIAWSIRLIGGYVIMATNREHLTGPPKGTKEL